MMCGALWQSDASADAMLRGVDEVLAPYGAGRSWTGSLGNWSVALRSFGSEAGPHVTASGAVVCADVFLHDRNELADELRAPSGATDVEIIGLGYDRWGRELCEQVSGNYSIAVLDPRLGGLFLARDHGGSRFLAVHHRNDAVAFASTALALTGFPGVGHELDTERLAELAVLGYGTTRTFVRGVSAVPPGSWSWFGADGQSSTNRWWRPEHIAIKDRGSLALHAQDLRDQFERSVASTLRDVDRVGVLLSGGLDSSSVAAVAATQLHPVELRSYTSVPPPGWRGRVPGRRVVDERAEVEALAAMTPNLRPSFIHVRGTSLFAHQHDLWELGGCADHNPENMLWHHECVRDAAADGVHTLLTGEVGNQAFSADGPLWLAALARRGRIPSVLREAQAWQRTTGKSVPASLRGYVLWPLLPQWFRSRRARRAGVDATSEWLSTTAIRPERLAELDLGNVLPEVTRPHPHGWSRDPVRNLMGIGAQVETEAAYRQRFGVELRDPTWDRRLTELALQQPEWWRRHDGVTRAICRAAMADVLPPEIVNRRTRGAQLPDWLDRMTDGREEIGVELQAMRDHPASREVFDVDILQAVFDAWPDRDKMDDWDAIYSVRFALMRSVVLSRYVRWFEERGRRVAAGGPAVVLGEPM